MPRIPPKGRPIQPGEARNPKGSSARARMQATLKKAHKTMTADEFSQLVSLFLWSSPQELVQLRNDPNASVLTKLVSKFLTQAHDKADISIFKVLLEATIGRARERKQHEVSGPDGGPVQTTALDESEILAELAELRKAREAVAKSKK